MLVISRGKGEGIVLECDGQEPITLKVIGIRRADSGRAYVQIGIDAQQSVAIRRDELSEFRKEERNGICDKQSEA